MNKIKTFTALALLFFFCSTNTVFAFSELYYLKDVKTTEIQPFVDNSYATYGYNVIKQNPYYGVSKANSDYAVVILQQSGNNMFYYYQSEDTNKINKAILKEIKKQNIVCEQSFNPNIISIYDNLAKETVSNAGAVKQYTFEEQEIIYSQPKQAAAQQNNTYRGAVVQLSIGTKIPVYLQNAINTATATKGDRIVAVLTQNLTYNGAVIAPQGSLVYGSLSKARNATYGSRNGRVVISFNQIVTPDNSVYDISAEEIDFTVSNEGKIAESVKSAATGAALGALAGLLVALVSDKRVGSSVAIGAGIGAGTSAIVSTAERGVDAEIPSFTELELTLTKPLSVSVNY